MSKGLIVDLSGAPIAALLLSIGILAAASARADEMQIAPAAVVVMPIEDDGANTEKRATAEVHLTCDTNLGGIHDGRATADASPSGAAGRKNIVVVSNSHIGVYRRSDCKSLSFISFYKFFESFQINSKALLLRPRVLYDPTVQRFFVFVVQIDDTKNFYTVYYAVSRNEAGTKWNVYKTLLQNGNKSFCKDRKYGRAGPWLVGRTGGRTGRWFIAASDGLPTAPIGHFGSFILSIGKRETLDGKPAVIKCFNHGVLKNVSRVVPPVVQDNSKTAYFLAAYGKVKWIARFKLVTSGADPAADKLTRTDDIKVPLEADAPEVTEPNGFRLGVCCSEFKTPTVQIGNLLWNTREVKVGKFARWRLYRFSATANKPLGEFTPSTLPGKNDHTFMSSVAVVSKAPGARAFVNFGRTIPSGGADPEARVTMMMAVGPNNSNAGWRFIVVAPSDAEHTAGATTYCGSGELPACTWGLYSSNQIDPVDNSFAWGFNSLVGGFRMIDWVVRAAQVEWN